jgi:hypothetical protein
MPHILSHDYDWVEASALETLTRFNRQAADYGYLPAEVEQIKSDLNSIHENAQSESGEALLSLMKKFYREVSDATNRAFARCQAQYEAGIIKWGSERMTEVISPTVEGPGEPVPPEYRYLTGWLQEPLPGLTLAEPVEVTETKLEAVLKQLKNGVEGIQDSYQFRLFLTTMSKFHNYSIGNQILIMLQQPDATHVAGFVTWKELGRWVKRGGKSISILAPRFPPRPTCPKCGAKVPKGAGFCPKCGASIEEGEIGVAPAYFIVVSVFDISQTDGKPLPEFEVPVLTGAVNEELFSKLLALMKAKGIPVSFESQPHLDPAIKGQYSPATGIWVRPEEPRAQQLKSLAHEIAHYYSEGVFRIPRHDAETIAESAAFVVGAHYGFDSGVRSFPYVALWARDKKVLEQNLASIRKVSTEIMEALEGAKIEILAATLFQAR